MQWHRPSFVELSLLAAVGIAACQDIASTDSPVEETSQNLNEVGKILDKSIGAPAVGLKAGVSICSWGVNRLDIFAQGNDNHLWHAFFAGGWSGWEDLSALPFIQGTHVALAGPPACVSWGTGRIDVVFYDANNQLGHVWYDNSWGRWDSFGPTFPAPFGRDAQFGISSWGPGRLDIFRRTTTFDLAHFRYDSSAGGWSTSWATELTGVVSSAPSVVSWGPNRLDVFFNSNNQLGHWWWDGFTHPFNPLGGFVTGRPAAASRGTELLDTLYAGIVDVQLGHTPLNRGWAAEESWSIQNVKNLDAVSWGPGRVDIVFQKGGDPNVWHTRMPTAQVLTQHNDKYRTGSNLKEFELNPINVPPRFGKLFERQVTGDVYAQVLYASNVDTYSNGRHNMIFVATEHNMLYGFDADDPAMSAPLAKRALGCPVPLPTWNIVQGTSENPCLFNLVPEIGITSTPVIDPDTNVMYVANLEASSTLTADSGQCQTLLPVVPIPVSCGTLNNTSKAKPSLSIKLRAIDIRHSQLNVLRTATINTAVAGLDPLLHGQRPALLLNNGNVMIAFGGYTDKPNYHGAVVAFRASDFAFRGVFNAAANGSPLGCGRQATGGAGIWQSGQGLAADDSGNMYFQTGNGKFDNSSSFSDSVIKLDGSLARKSTFTPFNERNLSVADADLASGGALFLPGLNLVVGGGKEGFMYLMNPSNLGGYNGPTPNVAACTPLSGSDAVLQSFRAVHPETAGTGLLSNIHGSPVFWNRADAPSLYIWSEHDHAYRYILTNGRAHTKAGTGSRVLGDAGNWQDGIPDAASTAISAEGAGDVMPGGFLSLTANGANAGSGIVWGTTEDRDATAEVADGRLFAFDANDLHTLWSSATKPADGFRSGLPGGKFGKFNPPTVANGKVYVGTFAPSSSAVGATNNIWDTSTRQTKVIVYGLTGK